MADKPDKKSDPAPAAPDKAAPRSGVLGKTPVMLGTVMLIEAAVLFAGFKMLGGGSPRAAAGADLVTIDPHANDKGAADKKRAVELLVLDFKAPNKASGRTFLCDVSIYVVTRGDKEKQVKDALKEREALIKDRIRTIIAQSDPEKLTGGSEPGLETLRRQVKYQLDIILGEGVIEEVLVPKCIPFRTDF